MRARGVGIVSSLVVGTGAVLGAQALYTARRRDLPTVVGADASGHEGDPSHRVVRVAAAGDSTLTGPGLDDPGDVWLRQALRMLADAHQRRFELQSFAVGGSRMADVMRDQLDPLIASRPDIAVVVVGTNDAIRFTPLGDVSTSCARLVERLAADIPNVLIGGVGDLANIARLRWPLAGALRLRGRAVDSIIRHTVARHDNVHYVNVSLADPEFRRGGASLFAADLFHPNRDGHALWAAISQVAFEQALRERIGANRR
ncbi:MAG: SGNH/GDSL hydrolase family protein [Acidimicrobiales bacterium]